MKTLAIRDRDLALLRHTFGRFPCVREVRIFGSRATGSARRGSDIDLAISAPDATARQWLELTEALEEAPIIYEFDVVRTERADNPRLLEKIAREGVRIYPEEQGEPHRAAAGLAKAPGSLSIEITDRDL